MDKFDKISFYPANICLPKNTDMTKWSVVACDQYTSQPDYWNGVEDFIGDGVSAYNLVLPEIYLNNADVDEKIKDININMDEYLKSVLSEHKDCYIYVERTLRSGSVRKGIVGMVDLEHYEFAPGNNAKIRATEGTVTERIPPRMKVRKNASLELPHVMLLIDDEEDAVFSTVADNLGEELYSFPLMMDSGYIKGSLVADNGLLADTLCSLMDKNEDKNGTMLFAVGDGNHSLATAKACWEELKSNSDVPQNHPARYALVEVVNIHDSGLLFEPIHRIVFGCDEEKLLDEFIKYCEAQTDEVENCQQLQVVNNCKATALYIKKPTSNLTVGTLQKFLDEYIAKYGGEVDYIHGADVVEELSKQPKTIGFLLPKPSKSSLFETIIKDGILPRKTFSMGEAYDKRFYTEARKIVF